MKSRAGTASPFADTAWFSMQLVAWQRHAGRHDLPWQNTRDPYLIWLSEIMLQQTQVNAVIPYFERFVARFPDLLSLARGEEDAVLSLWSGLGYYARARNLHRAAQQVVELHAGAFPRGFGAIEALPGIGRSTAGAIAVFAFGERRPILDGNVKRVLARFFGIDGYPGDRRVQDVLWRLADSLLPARDVETYTQGLMDLGAVVCMRARPRCDACPLAARCVALREDRTAALPVPRPRKALPQRTTAMLVLRRGNRVLLEKRPSAGVWGGLWSLPEVEPAGQVEQACIERYGVQVDRVCALPVVRHGFTHYRLDITPMQIDVARVSPQAEAPGRLWLTLDEAIGAAIPAPVRAILRGLDGLQQPD
ncbi:MAG TPA: A/G-specific adenine glycosylase [Burkholderiales bacterium]|nr:A/G-specific adenine glycosylase [Burkholderiales bacterium]